MTSMTASPGIASSERTTPTRRRFSTAVDRTMETWEGLLYRLPVVVMRRATLNARNRAAFDLGRDYATYSTAPVAAPRKVRHLQAVSS